MEELGYALAPVPFLSNAAAGLVLQAAGRTSRRSAGCPGSPRASSAGRWACCAARATLVPDADGASVIVLCGPRRAGGRALGGRGRAGRRPWTRRAASRGCGAGWGGARGRHRRASPRRWWPVRRAGRRRPAGDGDGRGVRARPQAVRAADRRLPGRLAPLRADAARDRGRPLGHLLRRVDRGRRAGVAPLAASMAKAYASDAGWRVCTSSLQVHGGIGFTWEHDLHFFLKRAKVDGLLLGSAREHRDASRSLSSVAAKPGRRPSPLPRQRGRERRQHPVAARARPGAPS